MKKSIFQMLLHAVQGAIVGVGAILPGVSGGVLAVAFGIYEPMMELFTHPFKTLKTQYKLFIPFGIGGAIGFVLLAKVVEAFFSFAPAIALMLFFGLICGTLPALFKASEKSDRKKSWAPFVVALSLAYLVFQTLEGAVNITMAPNFLNFVLSGFIWGLSFIVPGLSSSTFLIYFGLYEPLTAGIGNLDFSVLIPFGIGVGATVLLLARVIKALFDRHYAITSRIILGFVIASSLKILPKSFVSITEFAISFLCFAAGFAVSYIMDKMKKE